MVSQRTLFGRSTCGTITLNIITIQYNLKCAILLTQNRHVLNDRTSIFLLMIAPIVYNNKKKGHNKWFFQVLTTVPPLGWTTWPVIKEESSEARKTKEAAISAG